MTNCEPELRQRIIGIFYSRCNETEYFTPGVIQMMTDAESNSVRKTLEDLSNEGILNKISRGNRAVYSANSDYIPSSRNCVRA